MNRRRAICLDFDGVLHPTAEGAERATVASTAHARTDSRWRASD